MEYRTVTRPTITPAEYEALEAAEETPGGVCRAVRPETLGYQMCWRIAGHSDGVHLSQDGTAWIIPDE